MPKTKQQVTRGQIRALNAAIRDGVRITAKLATPNGSEFYMRVGKFRTRENVVQARSAIVPDYVPDTKCEWYPVAVVVLP